MAGLWGTCHRGSRGTDFPKIKKRQKLGQIELPEPKLCQYEPEGGKSDMAHLSRPFSQKRIFLKFWKFPKFRNFPRFWNFGIFRNFGKTPKFWKNCKNAGERSKMGQEGGWPILDPSPAFLQNFQTFGISEFLENSKFLENFKFHILSYQLTMYRKRVGWGFL